MHEALPKFEFDQSQAVLDLASDLSEAAWVRSSRPRMRSTEVRDPNRGTWSYQYDGFGELKTQLDARGLSLNQNFDLLGRMTSRSWAQPGRVSATLVSFVDYFSYENTFNGQYGTLKSTARSENNIALISESYFYDALNRPISKGYAYYAPGVNQLLNETTQYDPNFGRPVRKNFPAVAGAQPQKIYLGYTFGGEPMQTGFAASYLPSDPRNANATRNLRRYEGSNWRGQMLSSRFGSGDSTQAYQWLVSEYDASTGWLLSRCSGLTVCSGVAQPGTWLDTSATMKLGYEYDAFGNVSKSVNAR